MSLKNVIGVDHVVVTVRDLEAAAQAWAGLGFTVSPRGLHSPHIGTANYTIMLGEDYIELLGVVTETDQNAPTRAFLKEAEGIERTAFTALDAAAGAEELRADGLLPLGPVDFSRPVPLPEGGSGEASFTVFRWPLDQNPGGMRIFACQHHTRDTVWLPSLQKHANGAARLKTISIAASDPQAAADHMAKLIKQPVEAAAGGFRVRSGGDRADFLFVGRAAAPVAGLRAEGAIGLVLETSLASAPPPVIVSGLQLSFTTA